MTFTNRRCNGMRLDGAPCGSWAVNGSTRCLAHAEEPEIKARYRAAVKKGGETSPYRNKLMVPVQVTGDPLELGGSPLKIAKACEKIAELVATGAMAPAVGNALIVSLGMAVRAYEVASKIERPPEADRGTVVFEHAKARESIRAVWPWEVDGSASAAAPQGSVLEKPEREEPVDGP